MSTKTVGYQEANREWWESNPMTYDWEQTLQLQPGTQKWYQEIDRRFLESAYYAEGPDGRPFGRFLLPEVLQGKKVLEIGCGMGTHAEMLIRNGAFLTAVDQTHFAVSATSTRLKINHLDGHVVQQDAETLSFPGQVFDAVWTWGVIHHSTSTEQCLQEIARVLKPNGNLMMMVYYRPSIVYYVHCGVIRGLLMGQLLHKSLQRIYVQSSDGYYARVFTKTELRTMLAENFHNLRITVIGLKGELYPLPRTRFKLWLERCTPNWLAKLVLGRFGSMVVVEATRNYR